MQLNKGARKLVLGIITSILTLIIFICSMSIVGPGEVGVVSTFGKVDNHPINSGFNLLNPVSVVHKMTIQTQNYTMTATPAEGQVKGDDSIPVISNEGLTLNLDVAVLYHLNPTEAPRVFREIGENYVDTIVRPEVRNQIREVASQYSAQQLYSDKRDEYNAKLSQIIAKRLGEKGIVTESVLLRNISLPQQLNKSIQDKLSAQQDAEKMQYTLQASKVEAERKVVEAQGIRDAQDVISQKLTPEYLQWYSIDMMKNLANSQNTTFLFVPTGQNGMPIVNINPAK